MVSLSTLTGTGKLKTEEIDCANVSLSVSWKNTLQRVEAKAMDGRIQKEESSARFFAHDKRHLDGYLHDVCQKSP